MARALALGAMLVASAAAAGAARDKATHWINAFQPGDLLDLHVYISPDVRFAAFNDTSALKWHETGIQYDMAAEERSINLEIPTSDHLLANRSLYAHSFFSKQGGSPDPKNPAYNRSAVTHSVFALTVAGERLAPIGLYKLLTGEPAPWEEELRRGAAADAAAGTVGRYLPFWKPKLYLQLIVDHNSWPKDEMPYMYEQYLRAHRLTQWPRFRPLVYINELMVMRMHWVAINESLPTLPLEVTFKPLPAHRFQWMVNLQSSFKMNEETLGITEKESEDMRGMFVNTNPVLLYTTVAVSAVHLLFDILAFKNDVSFWRSVDTMEGLSSRTLVLNELMELVILLYLREQVAYRYTCCCTCCDTCCCTCCYTCCYTCCCTCYHTCGHPPLNSASRAPTVTPAVAPRVTSTVTPAGLKLAGADHVRAHAGARSLQDYQVVQRQEN